MIYTVSQISDTWKSTCLLKVCDQGVFALARFIAIANKKVSYKMVCNIPKGQ